MWGGAGRDDYDYEPDARIVLVTLYLCLVVTEPPPTVWLRVSIMQDFLRQCPEVQVGRNLLWGRGNSPAPGVCYG